MARYECFYSTGRQFVFTERPRLMKAGLLIVAFLGLIVGLSLGLTITMLGSSFLDFLIITVAGWLLYLAFELAFMRPASSVDISSYLLMSVIIGGLLALLTIGIRYSLLLELAITRIILCGAGGAALSIAPLGFMSLCCQEDERKHHISPVISDGEGSRAFEASSTSLACVEEEKGTWELVLQFMFWALSWQWWLDIGWHWRRDPDDESGSNDCITVHNRTLKLIKVCFYSPEDMVCWIPFGGISGHCVGFVRAGDRRSFKLPRRDKWEVEHPGGDLYPLKVFQPGMLDKELACYPKAQRGQSYAFFDVEGMVRHSKRLSLNARSEAGPPGGKRLRSNSVCSSSSEDDVSAWKLAGADRHQGSTEDMERSSSKEDSAQDPAQLAHDRSISLQPQFSLRRARALSHSQSSLSLQDKANSWPLKDNQNVGNLSQHQLQMAPPVLAGAGDTPIKRQPSSFPRLTRGFGHGHALHTATSRGEVRRAGPEEVVVRNRSNQEIRALLFRSTDYCYMVPLLSTPSRDNIQGGHEHRFNPKGTPDRDFTLKVYSVGPGARELTYLTVSRGQTYEFWDSLLS